MIVFASSRANPSFHRFLSSGKPMWSPYPVPTKQSLNVSPNLSMWPRKGVPSSIPATTRSFHRNSPRIRCAYTTDVRYVKYAPVLRSNVSSRAYVARLEGEHTCQDSPQSSASQRRMSRENERKDGVKQKVKDKVRTDIMLLGVK